ncbi:MAG TPA: PqqD family protein [Blastocatellia bacterium]|nr:PqqD family protein [Blastocatellia bacterium]
MQQLPGELLIYDLERHKAHCLNETAALIWKHCDGKTDIARLRSTLEKELKTAIDEEVIFLGLEQLRSRRLLVDDSIGTQNKMSPSRRAALKKLGAAALISLPAIISIAAPMAVAAATGLIPDAQCNSDAAVGGCCITARRLCRKTGSNFNCNGAAC